jgi:transcription initiation factor TFIIIB Brf1 subunit/transcription initiation factor TFIIB
MTAVPVGQVQQTRYDLDVCGTCACVVPPEHITRHIAWHAQTAAAAFPATVTNAVTPNRPGGNN